MCFKFFLQPLRRYVSPPTPVLAALFRFPFFLSFFFATSFCFFACRILAFCRYLKFLLQYNSVLKRLDQPPLLIIFYFKNPAKKRRHSSATNRAMPLSTYWLDMAAMLRDSVVVVVVVVRTRPRAIPLAMITMRKSTHGFPFLSHDADGAPLGGPSGRRSSAIKLTRQQEILKNAYLNTPLTKLVR